MDVASQHITRCVQQQSQFTGLVYHHCIKYLNKYLRVAYLLGGFQELNLINLDIIHETAFCDNKLMKAPVADEHENDIYEDEEIALSDIEDDDGVEGHERKDSLFLRFSQWISETFKCQKFKNE